MIKRGYILGMLITLAVAGCSDPHATQVPLGDPKDWPASFSEEVQKLPLEERQLLAAYAMRRGTAGTSPEIVTVSEAIEQQKIFEAERAARELEEKKLAEEARLLREQKLAAFRQTVTVALSGTKLLPKNYNASRYSPLFQMVLAVENKGAVDIRGIKGKVIFRDLFDDEIMQLNLSLDESVKAGEKKTINGYGMEINQFIDDHVRLANTKYEDLKFEFVPEMIVFADGTTQRMPD